VLHSKQHPLGAQFVISAITINAPIFSAIFGVLQAHPNLTVLVLEQATCDRSKVAELQMR